MEGAVFIFIFKFNIFYLDERCATATPVAALDCPLVRRSFEHLRCPRPSCSFVVQFATKKTLAERRVRSLFISVAYNCTRKPHPVNLEYLGKNTVPATSQLCLAVSILSKNASPNVRKGWTPR